MSWLEIWAMIHVMGMFITGSLVLFIILTAIYSTIKEVIKQSLCKHVYYRENRSCQAICNHCGKDLGFIGTVREQRAKK